ncbi:MAG: neutral/alkaline non-lysosomal ceramidase N-terminal domain-containing protein [Acidobacteria bacterium]|nr:neutral/alkaline non-lysosomal ceramidase N-terminal domain-containing protein [Acidobacteriota bacterium]
MRAAICAAAACLAPALLAADTGLRAGVARVEITPGGPMPMYGYAGRKCQGEGAHDPLYAKAVVLAWGDSRMAIVTLDLGSIVSDRLRAQAAEKLNIPVLLLAASHTHSGPLFPLDPAVESLYRDELERKVLGALSEAASAMFPARLGAGHGSIQLGYNRLLPRDDGRSRALFDNLERVPYGPVDPEFMLLAIEDDQGATRALLVHYAAHAVVLGPKSCKYSADYPGVMQARVEAEMPGTQVMFVQGGAGDINPLFQGRSGNEEQDFAVSTKMGELLAANVLRARREVQAIEAGEIRHKRDVIKFTERWNKTKTIDVGITTVLIGRDIAIAATSGELMHKLQIMWKQQADVRHAFFYGYTFSSGGVWPGYIPDLRSAAYGGYGADATTRIEVGARPPIGRQDLSVLGYRLGRLQSRDRN